MDGWIDEWIGRIEQIGQLDWRDRWLDRLEA